MRWGSGAIEIESPLRLLTNPAYAALADDGLDECGLTLLAGRSVGASFVGTVVGALVVAEAMRMTIGGPEYSLIDGSLRTPERRSAIVNTSVSTAFNPGYTHAKR